MKSLNSARKTLKGSRVNTYRKASRHRKIPKNMSYVDKGEKGKKEKCSLNSCRPKFKHSGFLNLREINFRLLGLRNSTMLGSHYSCQSFWFTIHRSQLTTQKRVAWTQWHDFLVLLKTLEKLSKVFQMSLLPLTLFFYVLLIRKIEAVLIWTVFVNWLLSLI